MARIEKTVFISYRRVDVYVALAVYKALTDKGYDVFFDYTSIPSGDFEQVIVGAIKARAHFVLILTPSALDRCSEPGDWLRREIEIAMDEKRNIIPLFFKGFSFRASSISGKLTGKLGTLSRYNGLGVHEEYFDAAMEKLMSKQFLNHPLDTVILPVSKEVQKVVEGEKVAADQALMQKQEDIKEIVKPVEASADKSDLELHIPPEYAGSTFTPAPAVVKIRLYGGIEFVKIPRGEFKMGSPENDPLTLDNEKPQHTVDMPYDFLMGRCPVTNQQFSEFAQAVNFQPDWGVHDWQDRKQHPVVNVSWKSVLVYCDWLNQQYGKDLPGGLVFRLPTEAEWEKAARGPDGLDYPWGNEFNPSRCNSRESGRKTTTPVGAYSPQSDSPYGVCDMAGNVWEWTASLWGRKWELSDFRYPYTPRDGRENLRASDASLRVLRGGSFMDTPQYVRAAVRDWNTIDYRLDSFGFRVVVAPRLTQYR